MGNCDYLRVKIADVEKRAIKLLSKNLTKRGATRALEPLIWSEMVGIHTQGLIKLMGGNSIQNIVPKGKILVGRETKASIVIDGNGNPALLASQIATDKLIKKAKKRGFAIAALHNVFSSNGVQAFYTNRMAREDLIGIMMTRSPATVAPFGSIEPLFGTNPISFAFPTTGNPIVLDMATSAITFFGLVQANMNGKKIPEGVAIDKEGNPTDDPAKAMDGAILPFDKSYKGSALGMVAEIMAGALASASFCDTALDKEWGSLFMSIDPSLLMDVPKFKQSCTELVAKIRKAKSKGGKIRVPSDRMWQVYEESKNAGEVDVDEPILKELGLI